MSTLRHARKNAVVLNGRSGIPTDMALGLEKAGWSTAESCLRNQLTYNR
jgi:hypothetical protein